MKLERCLVAITTPFARSGGVDYEALQAHATWLVDNGVSGIVVCGTTGESATLTDEEKIGSMNAVWDAVADRATVVGGAGNNCTFESLDFVELANEQARVHAIMSVVPYYNKPNQRGIIGHFNAIADTSRFPVVVYNVPGRTVVGMTVETVLTCCEHENVVGVKEASANLHMAAKLVAALPDDIALLSGDDATAMPFMALGGDGVISVVGNVAPTLMSEMAAAVSASDLATARRLNGRIAEIHDLMFRYPSPLPAKAIVQQLGFGSSEPRLPLAPLLGDELASILADAQRLEVTR